MDSLGQLVKKWREDSGLNVHEFARLIGNGVKYQNLQQLEGGRAKQPKYMVALAAAMNTTVDDLLALRMPPLKDADPKAPPQPPQNFADKRETSDSGWAVLEDLKAMPAKEREALIEEIHTRAEGYRAYLREALGNMKAPAPPQADTSQPSGDMIGGREQLSNSASRPKTKSKGQS